MPKVFVEKRARAQMRRLNDAQRDSLRDCLKKLVVRHDPPDCTHLETEQLWYRIQSKDVTTGYDYLPDTDLVRIWVLLIDAEESQNDPEFLQSLREIMSQD